MSEIGNIRLIEALQASWKDPDPEAFAALFTPDGSFEDVTYGIHVVGRDALRAHAARVKKHNVEMAVEVVTRDATGTTGVAEWRISHVFAGNFDGVDCTGKPVSIRGLSIYEFQDGQIARATDYWNYMEIVRTMGVIPRELRNFRVS